MSSYWSLKDDYGESDNWLKRQALFDFENGGLKEQFQERIGMDGNHPENISNIRRITEGESRYYENISDVPIEARAKASLGSRKMSSKIISKLTSRRLFSSKGDCDIQGASHACIDTMVYLCQINDNKGFIPNFAIKSLVGKTVTSSRGAYFVLELLEKKGFIKIDCYSKNGYRDITVLDNDFSDFKKSQRYLNLNRNCFNVGNINEDDTRGFVQFRKKSLYAKKLFLFLMFQYDAQSGKRGYRGSMKKLSKQLGLKNDALILGYVEELKPLCVDFKALLEGWDSNLHTYRSKKTGSNDTIISLRPDRCSAEPELLKNAPTCLKYQIENIFRQHDIPIVDRTYQSPATSTDRDIIVEELSGIVIWNGLQYKDTPICISDILKLLEDFICECDKFVYEHVKAFGIYIREFVRLSRHLIPSDYVMA